MTLKPFQYNNNYSKTNIRIALYMYIHKGSPDSNKSVAILENIAATEAH